MFYIHQLFNPTFPIGLVQTESGLLLDELRLAQGDDAYPFFWLSQAWPVTLRIQKSVFSGCTVLPDSKETKLESGNQEASPSAGKNTGVVLVAWLLMEVHPYNYFWWQGYFWGPWVSFVRRDEFSVRVTKMTLRIGVPWTQTFLFLTHLNLMNYGYFIKSM